MKPISWQRKLILYLVTHATLFSSFYMLGVQNAEETRKAYHRVVEGEKVEEGFNKNPYGVKLHYERNGDGQIQVFLQYNDRDTIKRKINSDLTCGTNQENIESIVEKARQSPQQELNETLDSLTGARRSIFSERYDNRQLEQGFADIDDIVYTVNPNDKIETFYKLSEELYPMTEQPGLVGQGKRAMKRISDYLFSE